MSPRIVTVHSRKGGVGKSTIAYELAWLLKGVLVDLDYEDGNATGTWGWEHEDRVTSPLIHALERGSTPKPLTGYNKPDLVPGHPDFVFYEGTAADVTDALMKWAREWGREWVVVDTHNGASEATTGALRAANVIVAPVPLAVKDLRATRSLIRELADYPLVLVPSKVDSAPELLVRRLAEMVEGTPVQVGPFVPFARPVARRTRRMAITSESPPAKALRPIAAAMEQVAQFVTEYVGE